MLGMLGTDKKLTAEFVRRQFPKCVVFADAVRDAFGDDVKVTYMEEAGDSVGAKSVIDKDKMFGLNEIVIESVESESIEYRNGKWVAKRAK